MDGEGSSGPTVGTGVGSNEELDADGLAAAVQPFSTSTIMIPRVRIRAEVPAAIIRAAFELIASLILPLASLARPRALR